MKSVWKWAGIVFDALAALIVIGLVIIYFKSQARLARVYNLSSELWRLGLSLWQERL